ncbi:alpha/beta hydrolase [Saccharomonospora saliphila]|uniref:alpha/beta hydrolase n=1 Tax=Saccharomonospora saliphila TaxID=369829 RepID=UPI000362D3E8|nr:alpha/beta hydrolase [Saccharomonospora saliphila]
MNVDELHSADIDAVDADAAAWMTLSEALETCADQVRNSVLGPIEGGAWRGDAADRAYSTISEDMRSLLRAADDAREVSRALATAAQRWRSAQANLLRAITQAPGLGLRIVHDGSAEPLPGKKPAQADVRELTELARKALAEAKDADEELTSILQDYADLAARSSLRNLATISIPSEASPSKVSRWWDALTFEQRRQLIQQNPAEIGSLDGVPATARHEANMALLEHELQRLQGDEDGETKIAKLENLRDRIIESHSTDAAPLYLLTFDHEGDGKIAISMGNPDTAENVSVYVPGMTAGLWTDGFATDLDRTRVMLEAADAKTEESVASVLWLDYDAPDDISAATETKYAEDGGPRLRQFVDGLQAAHDEGGAHTTLVAHSYGTVVAGEAAKHAPGMEADIISVAGPGFGIDDAASGDVESEIDLDGAVYEATSTADLIRPSHFFEVHGDAPGELPGTEILATEEDNGHGGYWSDEQFLHNVGNAIANQHGNLTFEPALQEAQKDTTTGAAVGAGIGGAIGGPVGATFGMTFGGLFPGAVDELGGFLGDVAQAAKDLID